MKKIDHLCCTNQLATTGKLNHHLDAKSNLDLLSSRINSNISSRTNKNEISESSIKRVNSTTCEPKSSSATRNSNGIENVILKSNSSDFTDEKDFESNSNLNHQLNKLNDHHWTQNLSSSSSIKISHLTNLFFSQFQNINHQKCSIISLFYRLILIISLIQISSAGIVPSISSIESSNYFKLDSFDQISVDTKFNSEFNKTIKKREIKKKDNFEFQVVGFRIEGERVEITSDQVTSVYSEIDYTVILYGVNFPEVNSSELLLSITSQEGSKGDDCSTNSKDVYNLTVIKDTIARTSIKFDQSDASKSKYYYVCIDYKSKSIHQGSELWMSIHVKNKVLPIWLQIFFICVLLCLAGLFSGLNLGLMALDLHELEVIESCGTPTEKRYAKRIKPVRKRGNYLLCTILLGNVMVQTTLTVLLEDLTSGLVAVMGSTFSIVVFGEIVPQAICSRQGLAIGANTVFLMWFFMLITFPISFPVSWTLDKMLGKEIGKIYDRDRLTEYLRITQRYNKLDSDELKIIQGALKLKKITVAEIMTKVEDIFSLPAKSVLNFNTLTLIQKSGFSRIPVYEKDRSNIVAVLFAKDLAFVDPDDKIPLQTLCQYYKHEISYVFEDSTCYTAFTLFKEGTSHMAFVVRVSEEYDGVEKDPHYEVLGLVTLEDVLEEVLQTEIVDETDVLTDNRKKKRRKEVDSRIDYAEFCLSNSENTVVSPQLVLVSYQYLSTSVVSFSKRFITENVLKKLINQNVYHKEDPISPYSDIRICKLYEQGKSYDYFILILEGYVVANVGKENLTFQSGPFTVFGSSTLKLQDEDNLTLESLDNQLNEPFNWVSDYTVEVVEKVTYLKINRNLYISAVRQSLEEQLKVSANENTIKNERSLSKADTTFNGLNPLKLKFTDKKN